MAGMAMSSKEGYWRRSAALFAAVVAGSMAVSGCGSKAAPSSCLSPRAESSVYPGDPNASPSDQSTWSTGIEITTRIPNGATGMVVGFRSRNGDWSSSNNSNLISPERASAVAVRIGHGAVVFSTQLQASSGSSLCSSPPESTFGQPQPFDQLIQQDVLVPAWR